MEISGAFATAIEEFIDNTRALIGHESAEDHPPLISRPEKPAALVQALLRLDSETIRRYAWSIGDDNPLFTDPDYGRASVYGSQIAPGPILVHCRYPADHGVSRKHGYPLANFLSGLAWEFYDVVRPGAVVSSSKKLREVLQPRGMRGGRLYMLVCEVTYFDARSQLLARAFGTLAQVPMEKMGASRAMDANGILESKLYHREPHRYSTTDIAAIEEGMASEVRRGPLPRFWEDVHVGEQIPAVVQPPYSIPDALSYQSLHQGLVRGYDGGHLARSFTPAYRALKAGWGYPDFARTHPVTQWPYTPGDEHEDALLCGFRGQPLPFDFGIQRAQVPQRLIGNWAGDAGFCRKMCVTMGRPVFHGDALIFKGQVIDKKTRKGHTSGSSYFDAIISIEVTNQRGEVVSRGYASVFLPSSSGEAVSLPVDLPTGSYIPYEQHHSAEWFR